MDYSQRIGERMERLPLIPLCYGHWDGSINHGGTNLAEIEKGFKHQDNSTFGID